MSFSKDNSTVTVLARSGSIDDACARYGLSRPKMYKMIKQFPQVAKRFGDMTLVDFAAVDAVIDSLPTTKEAPTLRARQLVNLPGSSRVSKVVAAARRRKATAEAAAQ
ncbi:MAG TPA: hypothetical protein VKJ47_23145 [Candidatus Binatia bacterium]|nr:hypothetical protein [Candidatus Binatia bacterium]